MLLRIKGITLMGLVYRQFPEEEIGAIKSEMIDFFYHKSNTETKEIREKDYAGLMRG